jgi:DNA (cytosine-5)-methyltransferase 1
MTTSLPEAAAGLLPGLKPSPVEQILGKPSSVSLATTMTPKERVAFQASITPEERKQREVNDYISTWLGGKRPESQAFQKFVLYANAKSDKDREKIVAGISETGKLAFKQQLEAMRLERDISMSPILGMVMPYMALGKPGIIASNVYEGLSGEFGLPTTPTNIAGGFLTAAKAGATAITTRSMEPLPLGFDPYGAMLPRAGQGKGDYASTGQFLRTQLSDLLQPETLALMMGTSGAIKFVAPKIAMMSPTAQRAVQTAFVLGNVPGMVDAIKEGDPKIIAASGLLAFAPDILTIAIPKTKAFIGARKIQAEVRRKVEAFDKANPGERQRLAAEAVQEGFDAEMPREIVATPKESSGELVAQVMAKASGEQSAEPVVPSIEPGVKPSIEEPPAPLTPEAPVQGQPTAPAGVLSLAEQDRITGELAALFGGYDPGSMRLTAEQRAANMREWNAGAARAVADYENIFQNEILPNIDNPTFLAIQGGNVRVAAATKQAELLSRLLADPTNVAAPEWVETSNKLGRIIAEVGSRAGLELAMTRWFTLGDIDWSAPDIGTRIAQTVQRLGISDPESLVAIAKTAQNVGQRQAGIHNAQDAAAAAAEAAGAAKPSQSRKTQARRAAARAAQTVRDIGPSEDDYNAAVERLRKLGQTINSGIDPTNISDLAIVGAYKLKNGLSDFILWSDDMVRQFGEKVRPYLQNVWNQIRYKSDYDFDTPKVNVMTMFSGGGVFEQGLVGRGVNLVAAVEYDKKIADWYRRVYGDHVINDDVKNVDYTQFRGKVDHLHASPVCKAFSKTRGGRAECILDMDMAEATARAIREIMPSSVTIENAPEYLKSEPFKVILGELQKQGYKISTDVVDAADFGTPQHRKRLMLRAWRLDGDLPEVTLTHGPGRPSPWNSWDAAIEDLIPTLPQAEMAPWQLQRLGVTGPEQIPVTGRGMVEPSTGGARPPRVFKTGEPSFTLTTGSGGRVVRVLNQAGESVNVTRLTPRANARIMGLPDSYPLPDQIGLAQTIIGNGVTPQMAAGVAGPMIDALAQAKAARGAGRLSEIPRSGPTQADFNAAVTRLGKLGEKLGAGFDPSGMSDVVIIGWYILKSASDAAGRKFSGWSEAIRNVMPDLSEAKLQELWINIKYQESLARGQRAADPLIFVEELSKLLRGRAQAVQFLDMMRDADGTPSILEKWISGDALTKEEQKRANDAWDQVMPRKKELTPEEKAARAEEPIGKFRSGRDELRALERDLERQRKDEASRTLAEVRKKVDARLDALKDLPAGLTGQKTRRVQVDAARYRENANLLSAHIRKTVKAYASLLPQDEVSALVSKVIDDFKGNFTDLEGAKAAITDGLRGMQPRKTARADFEAELIRRVGKGRAGEILGQLPDDVVEKIATGEKLTDNERLLVGQAYDTTRPVRLEPKPPTAAAQAVSVVAQAGKEARDLARRALAAQRGDFENRLREKYGVGRATRILELLAGSNIQRLVDAGESVELSDIESLAQAINKTAPAPRRPDTQIPDRVSQVILVAQERARGDADLLKASKGSVTQSGIDKKAFIPIAVQEYRNGARSLRSFREGIEKKYPGLFTPDEMDDMFSKASMKYSADITTLSAQKEQIARLVKSRLMEQRSGFEKFTQSILQFNNIFRTLALSADFGILFTQGGFAALSRPGILYAGLPSANAPNKLQKIEMFLTGQKSNRRSASVLSSMLQSWGSERKYGEFDGEALALQEINYGSPTFYRDSGLVLETVGGYDSALSRAETFTGSEALESMFGFGELYKRFPLGKPMYDRFERATAVGINRLRIGLFENLMMGYKDLPINQRDAVARILAQQVNLMTGRMPMNADMRLAVTKLASQLVTAPEYYASQAVMANPPLAMAMNSIRMGKEPDLEGLSKFQRAKLASAMGTEYARAFVSYTALKTVMQAAGYEVDENPLSPEFGSAKIPSLVGGYRPLDLTSGKGQYFSLIAQLIRGKTKDLGQQRGDGTTKYKPMNRFERIGSFISGKATIVPQTAITLGWPLAKTAGNKFGPEPTRLEEMKQWALADRRTASGRVFSFRDPTDAFAAMFSANLPASIFIRSFFDALSSMSNAGANPEQKARAVADWMGAATAGSFGIPVGRPRIKAELRPGINRIRRSPFMPEREKQRAELRAIYTGKTD